jgi:hypothetical protein
MINIHIKRKQWSQLLDKEEGVIREKDWGFFTLKNITNDSKLILEV